LLKSYRGILIDLKNIIIFILIILILYGVKSNSQNHLYKINSALSKLNYYLEKLEQSLKTNNYIDSCYESKTAFEIIELNSEELMRQEPNYNWSEIKGLLDKISIDSCHK
tara:strand:- start:1433 stop:1762 length:330 start_codon:yes stop_codon:yes gene_type:complete